MPLQTKLISVTIVYCKNGKQFKKEITEADFDKIGGLWWENGSASNNGHNYLPVPPQPLGTDCAMDLLTGGSACWWDPKTSQWICPDGLG